MELSMKINLSSANIFAIDDTDFVVARDISDVKPFVVRELDYPEDEEPDIQCITGHRHHIDLDYQCSDEELDEYLVALIRGNLGTPVTLWKPIKIGETEQIVLTRGGQVKIQRSFKDELNDIYGNVNDILLPVPFLLASTEY